MKGWNTCGQNWSAESPFLCLALQHTVPASLSPDHVALLEQDGSLQTPPSATLKSTSLTKSWMNQYAFQEKISCRSPLFSCR